MPILLRTLTLLLGLAALGSALADEPAVTPLKFRDVGKERGLIPAASKIQGHSAGWGDVDGDGWLDLYIGTFAEGGGQKNLLFRNTDGKFQRDPQEAVQIPTRSTGSVFADLDNDGDLDLYIASMPKPDKGLLGCRLFRNDGAGQFTDVSAGNGGCPEKFGGRSACVVDYDGDGLLDLLVGEEPNIGYNGSPTHSSRLFRNLGGLKFDDVSRAAGLPADMPGLGVAAADVNDDGWPDLFLAAPSGGNRLLLNDRRGKFTEAASSPETFRWEGAGGDNMICGVCFGDVNGDGRPDLVIGPHFKTPWVEPVAVRLYLHQGTQAGQPKFEDVTEAVGLTPLGLKAPHVEVQDFDNDGRLDILTSMVKFADGRPHPVIFQNAGNRAGLSQLRAPALEANDFPTADDRAVRGSGPFFKKMLAEGKVAYAAPGPSADFDNDGRLDLLLPSWWMELDTWLLRNETEAGRWLQIQLQGPEGVNAQGIGAQIRLYEPGKLGQADALIGVREMAVGFGYASAQPAIAHFGLGAREEVDVEITWPHGRGKTTHAGVKAGQRIKLP